MRIVCDSLHYGAQLVSRMIATFRSGSVGFFRREALFWARLTLTPGQARWWLSKDSDNRFSLAPLR
jgi:hypothetical protein